jgi:hypothetical protein
MNKKPLKCEIGFADSEYRYFQIIEGSNDLIIFLTSWDEREIKLEFFDVVRFAYVTGEMISEIYEITESSFLDESLDRCYVEKPLNIPYKHYQIEDLDDFPFIEVVAEGVKVVKTDKMVPFRN